MPGTRKEQQHGFTLMELLIVLTIVGILAGIGIPSFSQFLREGELRSRANSIIVAMQLARSEAVSRSKPVTACPSTFANEPPVCDLAGNWADGWIVGVDNNFGNDPDLAEILRRNNNDTKVKTTSSPEYVRFMPSGLRDTTEFDGEQTIKFERPDCTSASHARAVIVTEGGRAKVNQEAGC